MELKGIWNAETEYSVGDIVVEAEHKEVYHLRKACPAGTNPRETLYWQRLPQDQEQAVLRVMEAFFELSEKIPTNINDGAVILNSSTPDSTKQFIITVDDDGELTATELED